MAEKPGNKALEEGLNRRTFFANVFMGVGLAVSHLTAAAYAVRYLYPVSKERKQRVFVGLQAELPPGSAKVFTTPTGQTINIVHGPDGYVALSDVCPHLGCKVHWQSVAKEFICPCHDGHFDAGGAPTSGPPADMGASLARFDVATDESGVFIDLVVKS